VIRLKKVRLLLLAYSQFLSGRMHRSYRIERTFLRRHRVTFPKSAIRAIWGLYRQPAHCSHRAFTAAILGDIEIADMSCDLSASQANTIHSFSRRLPAAMVMSLWWQDVSYIPPLMSKWTIRIQDEEGWRRRRDLGLRP